MPYLIQWLIKKIKKEIAIWSITTYKMKEINRHIMNLPTEGVSPREEIFNKHLQDLLWTFWFGYPLHKR